MIFTELVRHRKAALEKQLRRLQEKYPGRPEGKVYCYTSDGKDYWRVKGPDGKKHHLPQSEKTRAMRMAADQTAREQMADLETEIEACRKFLTYMDKNGGKLEKMMAAATAAFKRLLGETSPLEDAKLVAWQNAAYEKSSYHQEQLRIATSQGFMVRSKAEALIAEVLFRLGIPCRYEPVIYLNGVRLVPDFMILNPVTYEIFYIEYNGLMDDPAYQERYLQKTKTYLSAGIVPDIRILYFHETAEAKIDMRTIQTQIELFLFGGVSVHEGRER